MPGPEATYVLSFTRATVSILRNIEEVNSDLSDPENLPAAFPEVAKHLPVIYHSLEAAQKQIRQRKNDSTCGEMKHYVAGCKDKATRLEEVFLKVVPLAADQRVEIYREAIREMGKENRVETLMKGILGDVNLLLTVDDEMKAAAESQLGKLAEATKEVSAIPPSPQDESPASAINNYGSGPQNVVIGGTQHNNNGPGQQFIGSTFHGFNPFHNQ